MSLHGLYSVLIQYRLEFFVYTALIYLRIVVQSFRLRYRLACFSLSDFFLTRPTCEDVNYEVIKTNLRESPTKD